MRNRLVYAGFGVLATVVGMAAGHLVAALTEPAASPVLAVGSTVIDLTPTPVKEWAVSTFGAWDKPILIGSVLLGTLVFAAMAGILARRRFTVGAVMLVLLVALAAAAALTRPTAGLLDVVPSLATGVTGVAALWWLTRTAAKPVVRHGDGPTRRGVLVAGGALVVAAAAMAGAGRWITSYRTRPGSVALPGPADPARAFPTGLEDEVTGITPLRTANQDFYRVDTRLALPVVSADDWTLTIDGDVENELELTFDDIAAMELIERDITLTCVSNEVGGELVGGARWLGCRLTDLLDRANVGGAADQILSTDVDGMTISTPLEAATDGRDAMLAIGMNGEALPREHGFPARLVIPGLYGFVSATKWVTRLTLTTYDDAQAYWTERDWATDAPIKVSSRIDTPKAFATLKPGDTVVGGMAWAQQRGIGKVEVRIGGGGWQEAKLGPSVGEDYWVQWYFPWQAEPGQYSIAVRATTKDGQVQTAARATPFPNGSSGIQEYSVTVR